MFDDAGGPIWSLADADPAAQTARIGMYPALFSQTMTGVGLEPTTSGLKGLIGLRATRCQITTNV